MGWTTQNPTPKQIRGELKQPNSIQASANQSGGTNNSSSGDHKPKGENIGSILKVPSYEATDSKIAQIHLQEQQDSHGHIVQLQQRDGNDEMLQNKPVSILAGKSRSH